jgi:hypothetical protein
MPTWYGIVSLGALAILAGCSSSRRPATAPPPRPANSVELGIIPPQEVKPHRPYVQFDASVALPEDSLQWQAEPSAVIRNDLNHP